MFLKKRVGKLVCSKRHTVKTTIELYKYLDEDNQRLLARILNQMWTEESYPANFAYAEVVSLYKKGNPELPEHYRPIFFAELIKQHFDQICTEKTCRRHWSVCKWHTIWIQEGQKYFRTSILPAPITRPSRNRAPEHHISFLRLGKGFWQNITPKVIWRTGTNEDWRQNDQQH